MLYSILFCKNFFDRSNSRTVELTMCGGLNHCNQLHKSNALYEDGNCTAKSVVI